PSCSKVETAPPVIFITPPDRRIVFPLTDTSIDAVVHAYRPMILELTWTEAPFQVRLESFVESAARLCHASTSATNRSRSIPLLNARRGMIIALPLRPVITRVLPSSWTDLISNHRRAPLRRPMDVLNPDSSSSRVRTCGLYRACGHRGRSAMQQSMAASPRTADDNQSSPFTNAAANAATTP